MRRHGGYGFIVWLLVACGAQRAGSGAAADLDRCHRDEDCIAVVGNPCNPCGSCPGEAVSVMTSAHYQHMLKTEAYCPARDFQDPSMPRPSCSPCPGSATAGAATTAVCAAGACVARFAP